MLGFNSTLTAAVEAPRRRQFEQISSLIRLHPTSEAALRRLAQDPATTLCIVSGAERERLDHFFGHLPVWLVAENGVFLRGPEPNGFWMNTMENLHLEWCVTGESERRQQRLRRCRSSLDSLLP